ncbi:lipocalin family protein [Paraflavitalea soli]|nr:lipocalin family protein [Paraflavitalea soli]
MRSTILSWAVPAVAASLLLFSCKKDKSESNNGECSTSMTGLSGSYKLTALQYKLTASSVSVDYLAYREDCEKDDILVLKSDGTWEYNDLGTVCTPSGSEKGTWKVSGNTLTSDGTLNGTIAGYDCKTMVYYVENTLKAGDRMTFTLVKQ